MKHYGIFSILLSAGLIIGAENKIDNNNILVNNYRKREISNLEQYMDFLNHSSKKSKKSQQRLKELSSLFLKVKSNPLFEKETRNCLVKICDSLNIMHKSFVTNVELIEEISKNEIDLSKSYTGEYKILVSNIEKVDDDYCDVTLSMFHDYINDKGLKFYVNEIEVGREELKHVNYDKDNIFIKSIHPITLEEKIYYKKTNDSIK